MAAMQVGGRGPPAVAIEAATAAITASTMTSFATLIEPPSRATPGQEVLRACAAPGLASVEEDRHRGREAVQEAAAADRPDLAAAEEPGERGRAQCLRKRPGIVVCLREHRAAAA